MRRPRSPKRCGADPDARPLASPLPCPPPPLPCPPPPLPCLPWSLDSLLFRPLTPAAPAAPAAPAGPAAPAASAAPSPQLHGAFASVVIDPPFITADAWRKYAQTARLLLAPGGRVIGTTIIENAPLLNDLLGVTPNVFLPSIPQLPYQYGVYTNFASPLLAERNAEVPVDPGEMMVAAAAAAAARKEEGAEREAPIRKQTKTWEEMLAEAEAANPNPNPS